MSGFKLAGGLEITDSGSNNPSARGQLVVRGYAQVLSTTASTSSTTGSLTTAGGLGVAGSATIGGTFSSAGPVLSQVTVSATKTSAATLTASEVVSGLAIVDPTSASFTLTLPTAALIVAAIPNATVNTCFYYRLRSITGGANTVTLAAGTGVTLATGNTNTVSGGSTRTFMLVLTNVATPAITAYSLGTSVH